MRIRGNLIALSQEAVQPLSNWLEDSIIPVKRAHHHQLVLQAEKKNQNGSTVSKENDRERKKTRKGLQHMGPDNNSFTGAIKISWGHERKRAEKGPTTQRNLIPQPYAKTRGNRSRPETPVPARNIGKAWS